MSLSSLFNGTNRRPIWSVKGTVSRDFLLPVFYINPSPKPLKITLGLFQFFWRFAEIFASQGAPLVSTTLVANCAMSTIPAENCHRYQWHQRQIYHRCQWHRRQIHHRCERHQWQIMGTISVFWQLKVNLKEKIYLNVNSTTQRWPKK